LCYTSAPRLDAVVKEMKDAVIHENFALMLAICDNFNYECAEFFKALDTLFETKH
jgi:hypothetical protein